MVLSAGNGDHGNAMACGFRAPSATSSGTMSAWPGGSGRSSCARSQPACAADGAGVDGAGVDGIRAGRPGMAICQLPPGAEAVLEIGCQLVPSQYAQLIGQFSHCQLSGDASVSVMSLPPGWVSSGSQAMKS